MIFPLPRCHGKANVAFCDGHIESRPATSGTWRRTAFFSRREPLNFYTPAADGIDVARVIYGGRDLPGAFHQA